MKFSLMRDCDALGAAVGVRTLPAPHAAMNGAPEALSIVHCLMARRVQAMSPELTRQTFRQGLFYIHWNPGAGHSEQDGRPDISQLSIRDALPLEV